MGEMINIMPSKIITIIAIYSTIKKILWKFFDILECKYCANIELINITLLMPSAIAIALKNPLR